MKKYFDPKELPVIGGGNDKRIWAADLIGKFTVSNAVQQVRVKYQKIHWAKYVWGPYIHPYTSCNVWKILRGACVTEEIVRKKGFTTVSKCYLCGNGQDNMDHILWKCTFSKEIWRWLGGMFNVAAPEKFDEVLACIKSQSSAMRQIWYISSFSVIVELWMARNLKYHENLNANNVSFKNKILNFTKECGVRVKGYMRNCLQDLNIITTFGIKGIRSKCVVVKEVFIARSSEGAAQENPGPAGIGFIARSSEGACLGAGNGGLGITTNYIAEVMALITAREWAVKKQLLDICFSLDSKVVILAFISGKIPWIVQNRWRNILQGLRSVSFRNSYREINFLADHLAKDGAKLSRGVLVFYGGKPNTLRIMEQEDAHYFKFS